MDERVVLVRVFNLERDTENFSAAGLSLSPGNRCIVDHNGLRMGIVLNILDAGTGIGEHLDRVVRPASADDLAAYARNLKEADQALASTREIIPRYGLPMHLVAAEYTLDRSHLRIYFTAPHRVDFRALLRELAATFGVRIELRQMGARDEAKIKGGIGRCGRVVCCHSFLHEPPSIPMEIAYDQELFVSPERITGICGRLMCCLAYEHETYKREIAKMPKLGTHVKYGKHRGKVISHNIFRHTITILTDNDERLEVEPMKAEIIGPVRK